MSLADSSTVSTVSSSVDAASGPPLQWLWVAIGVLGVSVVALGTTLVVQNSGKPAVTPQVATEAMASGAPQALLAQPGMAMAATHPQGLVALNGANGQAPASSPAWAEQPAPGRLPPQQQQPAQRPLHQASVVQTAARAPLCGTCGRIESVQAVQQAAPASGVGAVAGGVLGAVVGNQVGKGSGRTAATVLGAVGGGYVGHKVEERTRTQTVYQLTVRMDDGSTRRFTRSQPTAVGTPIVLQGKGFRTDDGAASRTSAPYPAPQSGMVRVGDTY
jgi:outer membrane lipoprotein SlyB